MGQRLFGYMLRVLPHHPEEASSFFPDGHKSTAGFVQPETDSKNVPSYNRRRAYRGGVPRRTLLCRIQSLACASRN